MLKTVDAMEETTTGQTTCWPWSHLESTANISVGHNPALLIIELDELISSELDDYVRVVFSRRYQKERIMNY